MRKIICVIDERHLVSRMERCRGGVMRKRIKCVALNATLLREMLPKSTGFFIVLVLIWLIWAQEPSSATASACTFLTRDNILHFFLQACIISSLVLPALCIYINAPEK
jgi:hypothetical protein